MIAVTLGDTMGNVEAQVLFDAFADTPEEVEPKTLKYTMAAVMTEAIIDSRLRYLANHWGLGG